jgi:DNA modification methylase
MIELINGDCLEEMKKIPDGSIDLVLTDPPYGKKADKGTNGFGSAKNRKYVSQWDSVVPQKEVFDEMLRIGKNVIIFGGNYFAHLLPPSKCWFVWDKKGDIAFQNPFADCELIYTNYTKPVKKYVFKQQGFITDSKDKRFHPTQKPSELVERLLTDWTKDGATVLDPFMGSGTTGVACKNLNRNFIGIELDKDYFEIARTRIGV